METTPFQPLAEAVEIISRPATRYHRMRRRAIALGCNVCTHPRNEEEKEKERERVT